MRHLAENHRGVCALDILITVLVASILLFAAASQFGAYDTLSVSATGSENVLAHD